MNTTYIYIGSIYYHLQIPHQSLPLLGQTDLMQATSELVQILDLKPLQLINVFCFYFLFQFYVSIFQKFLNHLQHNLIHEPIIPPPLRHGRCVSSVVVFMILILFLPELDTSHDPVGVGFRPGPFMPQPNV